MAASENKMTGERNNYSFVCDASEWLPRCACNDYVDCTFCISLSPPPSVVPRRVLHRRALRSLASLTIAKRVGERWSHACSLFVQWNVASVSSLLALD